MYRSYIRRPNASTRAMTARDVAKAYHYPDSTGERVTVGVIELDGGFHMSNLRAAAQLLNLPLLPSITAVRVLGNDNSPGSDADSEVELDIQVILGVAPAASQRVYFAPNTDAGFLEAIKMAIADKVTAISISWGAPETAWTKSAMLAMNNAFMKARSSGIVVFCASGDSGSNDGTDSPVTDFPASSPHVIACGGTRLTLTSIGNRAFETVWDDDDLTSATGGGISKAFSGRLVPDVAGNADPVTGYLICLGGRVEVIGGTSAVAPLYTGLVASLSSALGYTVGSKVDLMNTLLTNLGVCFDVTSGDNGAYRAGLGRDQTTGLGVIDGGKLFAVLSDSTADPAPFPGGTTPPNPTPVDPPVGAVTQQDRNLAKAAHAWLTGKGL